MLGLFAQIKMFFLTLLLGVLAGIIFHYYQLTIRALHARKAALYLLDVFFWLWMIVLISIGMLLINQGELRIYIFAVLLAGSLLYFKWLAGITGKPMNELARSSAFVLQTAGRLLIKPLQFVKKTLQSRWQRKREPPPPEEPF